MRTGLVVGLCAAMAAARGGVARAEGPAGGAGYSGHGAESLAPALLEKFRPLPLPAELSRKVQAYFDVRAPSSGTLSPDGKALYFTWTVTGVSQIWKLAGPDRFPQQLTGGEDSTTLADVTPDGRWLVVQRDRKGEENPGLYLLDPAGGPLLEVQHKPGVQTQHNLVSDDGRTLYFRANDVKKDSYVIYRFDVAAHTREVVFDREGLWSLADIDRQNGALLLQRATGALSAEYWSYDPATRQATPLFGQGESEDYATGAWAAAPGEGFVVTNKPGNYRRLYRFRGGELTPVSAEANHDVVGAHINRERTRIVYTTNEGGFFRLHAIDPRTWKPIAFPKLPDADNFYHGRATPDGRYSTVSVDDGAHPAQSYVIDWKRGQLTRWHAPSAPEIDTTTFVRAVLETYPARDGTPIPALVRRSAACERATCPVVIQFHGGPEAQARPGFYPQGQLFVDAGFVFVEPNVRGSDGQGKAWVRADDGPRRLAVIGDIEDAASWARKRFAVGGQAPRVGILGGSYGGYSVLMGMTRFAGAYDAGVDIVGISDLRTFLRNTAPYRRLLRVTEYGDPDKDAAALAELSPMTHVDKIRAPLLILQGATDPRVPAGEAVQIHEAVQRKGVPGQLMIFADEGHGAQKRDNRVLMVGHALAWFGKHLR